jgi:hypothetical protein
LLPASAISSEFSLPWLNGFLSLLYIAAAACLVLASLKITDTLACVLVAGLMVSFPVVTGSFNYMFTADAYFFALLLACLAAFLAECYKYGFVFAVIPLTLSLGTYQAYFGVAAGLLVMILVFDTLDCQTELRKVIIKGFKFAGTLIVSMLVYMGITRLVLFANGLSLARYGGIDRMGRLSVSDIPRLIFEAYKGVIHFFLYVRGNYDIWYYNIHHQSTIMLFFIAFALCVFLLVSWCISANIHRDGKRLVLLATLLFLLPLSCNIIYVMSPEHRQLLMLYGLVLILVFVVAVVARHPYQKNQKTERAHLISCWVITMAVVCAIWNYAVLANKSNLKMAMGYEQAYAQSISLITRIQGLSGYSHDKEIIIVGFPYQDMENYNISPLAAFNGFTIAGESSNQLFGVMSSYNTYLNSYLGLRQHVLLLPNDFSIIEENGAAAVLAAIPQYPDEGSLIIIDDKIYVKFSYKPPAAQDN